MLLDAWRIHGVVVAHRVVSAAVPVGVYGATRAGGLLHYPCRQGDQPLAGAVVLEDAGLGAVGDDDPASGRFHVRYPVLPGVFQGVRPSHDMARGSGSDKTAGSSRGALSQALVWIGGNPPGRTGAMCLMRRQYPPRGSGC